MKKIFLMLAMLAGLGACASGMHDEVIAHRGSRMMTP